MKRYYVSIHGSNLLINLRGEMGKYGFQTKRYVVASNEEEAEAAAFRLIFRDTDLQQIILNDENDPPSLDIDGMKEVDTPEENTEKDMKINYFREHEI